MPRARYATALAATALVGGLWLAVDAAPAAAQSVRDQVLAVTRGTMELGGAKVALGTVAGDDARFTVTGSTITQTTEGKTSTVTIGTITFIGAKPTADGGFTADEIDLDKVAIAESDGKGSIEHAAFQRVTARTADVVKRTNGFAEMVEAFDLTGVVVVGEDGKAIPIAAVHGTSADWVDGFPHKGSFEMRGLVVPFDPKDEGSKELTALGYTTASVDLVVSGTWDDKVGRLDLTQSTSGADMGALEVALTVGGLTRDVVTKMRDAGDDQAKQMELLQGLSLEKARIRWTDASLTTRLLDAKAKEQGTDRATFAKQLKLMVPMLTSAIGNKPFEQKITAAVGAYLDAPKSLTVKATPAAPLPLSQIMGAAMMAPQSLPTVLSADVTAND